MKKEEKIKLIDHKTFDDLEIKRGVLIAYENDDFERNKITKIFEQQKQAKEQ